MVRLGSWSLGLLGGVGWGVLPTPPAGATLNRGYDSGRGSVCGVCSGCIVGAILRDMSNERPVGREVTPRPASDAIDHSVGVCP